MMKMLLPRSTPPPHSLAVKGARRDKQNVAASPQTCLASAGTKKVLVGRKLGTTEIDEELCLNIKSRK